MIPWLKLLSSLIIVTFSRGETSCHYLGIWHYLGSNNYERLQFNESFIVLWFLFFLIVLTKGQIFRVSRLSWVFSMLFFLTFFQPLQFDMIIFIEINHFKRSSGPTFFAIMLLTPSLRKLQSCHLYFLRKSIRSRL